MFSFSHWIHHLFSPHCEICYERESFKREEDNICQTCEAYKIQINQLIAQNQFLMGKLFPEQREQIQVSPDVKPIIRGPIPWKVKQQQLEEEDRAKARVAKEVEKKINAENKPAEVQSETSKTAGSIEELEKEVLGAQ